jgi:hypothetical protein
VARARVVSAYEMMLKHFGMELVDAATGEVQRAGNFAARTSVIST